MKKKIISSLSQSLRPIYLSIYRGDCYCNIAFITTVFADNPRPNQITFQDPATPAMLGIIDLHHEIMFWLTFIVFFVLQLLFIEIYYFSYTVSESMSIKFFAKRFRFTSCSVLETIWTILPIYILWSIASPSLALLYSIEEEKNPDLTIKIVGRQWYWNYEITDFIEFITNFKPVNLIFDSYLSRNEDVKGYVRLLDVDNAIYFPIRTELRLIITSDDVIHSWTVPSFGIKLDAIPGRLNTSIIFISRKGVFYGQCSELCGVGHGFMPITAVVTGRVAFFDWVIKATEIKKYTIFAHIILSEMHETLDYGIKNIKEYVNIVGPSTNDYIARGVEARIMNDPSIMERMQDTEVKALDMDLWDVGVADAGVPKGFKLGTSILTNKLPNPEKHTPADYQEIRRCFIEYCYITGDTDNKVYIEELTKELKYIADHGGVPSNEVMSDPVLKKYVINFAIENADCINTNTTGINNTTGVTEIKDSSYYDWTNPEIKKYVLYTAIYGEMPEGLSTELYERIRISFISFCYETGETGQSFFIREMCKELKYIIDHGGVPSDEVMANPTLKKHVLNFAINHVIEWDGLYGRGIHETLDEEIDNNNDGGTDSNT